MKLPSIQQVFEDASRTLKRFPFVLADAAIWTVAALILLDYEGPPTSSILFKVLFASTLGFPLLLATSLVAERRAWRKPIALGVQTICVLLLVAYALTVPTTLDFAPEYHVSRFLMLVLALSLLVVTAPYIARGQLNGFWHYNKSLLQRIFLSGVFSLTLYAGLAIAMASVDQLFGVDIPVKRYPELGLSILGIFATWFFLSDAPENMDRLDARTDYPRVLRVFGQYILSPMLIVYFVILYAYVGKIIIEWSWPKGVVSGLIFGFAAMGIAAYLLLYPMRDRSEYGWIKVAVRWFWIVMMPMVVVLELAIWRRVSEYGITENRYFGMVIGVWLAAMAVYFLFSRTKNIKVIPASIGILALLGCFGPWGVFRVSERSQVGRLEELLTRNQILIDGKVRQAVGQIPTDDVWQISSIVRYLREHHGYDRIEPWFSMSLKLDSTGVGLIDQTPDSVVHAMGLEYARFLSHAGRGIRRLMADVEGTIGIEGYDHLVIAQTPRGDIAGIGQIRNGATCRVDTSRCTITLDVVEDGLVIDTVQVDLQSFLDSLLEDYGGAVERTIPPERMSVEMATETLKLKLMFQSLSLRGGADSFRPLDFEAVVVYSRLP